MAHLNASDDSLKVIIGQIRELYVDILQLRVDDRNKYKEMCNRLDVLEKDRSARTKKQRLVRRSRKPSQSNGIPKGASKEDAKKSQDTPKSLKNDEDGSKKTE